ncbi:MAG TPA: sigma-70 family RNA polymerase sigma factor [Candidatus Dormibacteraeota bacterium]
MQIGQVEAKAHTADSRTPSPSRPEPFDAIFRAEYPRVVAVANRVLDDPAEAEDVAQEVFWDLHRRHPEGMPLAGRWLHSAAVHTALNRLRSRKRRQRREELAERREPAGRAGDDPAQMHLRAETRRLVREALARLPTRKAAVLGLRYSGLSYAEVAAAMGVSTGQVGTLLRRAEASLAKQLEDI